MKAIIENEIINTNHESLRIFSKIIEVIVSVSNEQELRDRMHTERVKNTNFDKYFQYGFGSTHMWVNEIGSRNRLLIVEF